MKSSLAHWHVENETEALQANPMPSIEQELFKFPAADFVRSCHTELAAKMDSRRLEGVALGASGGIDSALAAALCARALRHSGQSRVAALQMIDARVKGEYYNSEVYRVVGAEFERIDLTHRIEQAERRLGAPSRFLTTMGMKVLLRWLPVKVRRHIILQIMSANAPSWITRHYQALTTAHRVRMEVLQNFAADHHLLVVVCANLTEVSLGFFVEQGVDDATMGDYAPLAGIYKSQVYRTAGYLGLPDYLLAQPPSPGFGGIGDEEILGPYEKVDVVLAALARSWNEDQIRQELARQSARRANHKLAAKRCYRSIAYVRFLRALLESARAKKNLAENEDMS
ncbi:hypothetical protein [Desulfoferrobacter suflitae]|uniref:hypothetical protein n=1 Tax=Desulfoferrobacter suflitae TaxID=2865782 RepID=UPI002164A700|nr:hypothetical protein [Desulfoferrobacter suflitae]MCK8603714.1 hypothetical protein [Desulfoferrobacter suflitae]